jgi:hypothetical protein
MKLNTLNKPEAGKNLNDYTYTLLLITQVSHSSHPLQGLGAA